MEAKTMDSTAAGADQPTTHAYPDQTSVVHRVFNIQEILCNVMAYNERDVSVTCMRVCRYWGDAARDFVWLKMDSLMPLLNLLGPMQQRTTDENHLVSSSY